MKLTCGSLVEECYYTICSYYVQISSGTAKAAEGDTYSHSVSYYYY